MPECGEIANKNGIVVGPTVLTNLSAEPGGNTGVSAAEVYGYYRNLWEQRDGWWWKAFGNDSDGFTVWDFLSMMAYYEAGFDPSIATIMAEAGVRFFYERAQTLNTPTTVEYLLDWWAHFSESTARLVRSNARPQLWNGIKNVKKFKVVGDSFRSPPSSWQEGWAYNRPYDWSNAYILSVDTVRMYEDNQYALFIRIPGDRPENTFYIPSGCAWFNWQSKDNYGVSCPPVP